MIPSAKSQEPGELLAFRKQFGARYENMPGSVKAVVKRSLAEEQGFLCAYCMRRLPQASIDDAGNTDVTIEHWSPQNPQDGSPQHDPLDYRNMLAVCDGNRGDVRPNMTCDAARGNAPITVNPLHPSTLAEIYYQSNGEIHSANEDVEHDLTVTLNLNCAAVSLPENRKRALQALQYSVGKGYQGKEVPRERLQKLLEHYESESGKKTPYVGVLTFWLRKRLQR